MMPTSCATSYFFFSPQGHSHTQSQYLEGGPRGTWRYVTPFGKTSLLARFLLTWRHCNLFTYSQTLKTFAMKGYTLSILPLHGEKMGLTTRQIISSQLFVCVLYKDCTHLKIHMMFCLFLMYSAIRIFDVLLLVPNVLFLMFLMYRLGVAHVQLYRIRCPIVKTVYFMVGNNFQMGLNVIWAKFEMSQSWPVVFQDNHA